jgi:hypothetical protein
MENVVDVARPEEMQIRDALSGTATHDAKAIPRRRDAERTRLVAARRVSRP